MSQISDISSSVPSVKRLRVSDDFGPFDIERIVSRDTANASSVAVQTSSNSGSSARGGEAMANFLLESPRQDGQICSQFSTNGRPESVVGISGRWSKQPPIRCDFLYLEGCTTLPPVGISTLVRDAVRVPIAIEPFTAAARASTGTCRRTPPETWTTTGCGGARLTRRRTGARRGGRWCSASNAGYRPALQIFERRPWHIRP